MTASPIRYQRQVSDRKGKIFYTSITSLSQISKKAGIPCITVSGKAGGENHMWNMARIDGRWLYYDPTGDRGRADYGFLYCGVKGEALDRHTWDADWSNRLSEALFSL